MSDTNRAKTQAARAAAALVEDGMTVGLGTGSTSSLMLSHLGARIRTEALRIVGVPSSLATAELARSLGVPIRDVDDIETLDLCLDGADEVDPQFRLIKGRGGALLREKIVASSSRLRVTIITADKRVTHLGLKSPVPVEVSAVGLKHTAKRLSALCARAVIRDRADGSPYRTDGGNAIVDCWFESIDDPEQLDCRLQSVVGVFETGLFLGLCDLLVIGNDHGAERIERPSSPRTPALDP